VDLGELERWLNEYTRTSLAHDPAAEEELFSVTARYFASPWDEPYSGREAIMAFWAKEMNGPRLEDAWCRPVAIGPEVAVAEWWGRYEPEPGEKQGAEYSSLFTLRFDDGGRCSEFKEWYLAKPRGN
jgi:SnoaL-like domain